jgi:hypothetical protein
VLSGCVKEDLIVLVALEQALPDEQTEECGSDSSTGDQ